MWNQIIFKPSSMTKAAMTMSCYLKKADLSSVYAGKDGSLLIIRFPSGKVQVPMYTTP